VNYLTDAVNCLDQTVGNGTIVKYFEVLSQHLHGGTKKHHETSLS